MTRGSRKGATAVEFAIVAPALFIILLGIIEVGRAFMVVSLLSDVARDACRYAVVTEGTNKTSSDIQTFATSRLAAYRITTVHTPVVYVNGSSSTDLSTSTGPAQQAGSANFGKYSNGTDVTVKVQVDFSEVTWLPFANVILGSVTLSGQSSLRRDPL
jgi:Flp pilus assembly protein TadG